MNWPNNSKKRRNCEKLTSRLIRSRKEIDFHVNHIIFEEEKKKTNINYFTSVKLVKMA